MEGQVGWGDPVGAVVSKVWAEDWGGRVGAVYKTPAAGARELVSVQVFFAFFNQNSTLQLMGCRRR